jgi:uncharacterized protein (TIGR03435 family)
MMESDCELLRKYASEGNEPAFTELVRRHLNLVYSVACRESNGDPAQAQDIAQLVFIELAKKARRLTGHPALVGWLYSSTRLMSANLRRSQKRRLIREQSVESMKDSLAPPNNEPSGDLLKELLDEVLHQLTERDRGAVVLRFLEGHNLREVGAALGVSEDAARMRVERALEKLRHLLARRGVTSTASGLSTVLGGALLPINSQVAANVAAIAGTAVKGAAATATTSTALLDLLIGALNAKAAIALTTVVLVAGTAVLVTQNARIPARRPTTVAPAEWIWTTDALSNVPPMVIIRPTKFDQNMGISRGTRLRWRSDSLRHLIAFAYNVEEQQLVLTTTLPEGKYDWLVTRGDPLTELRREIKKQFNIVGQRNRSTMDVLVLQPTTNEAPELSAVKGFFIGSARKGTNRLDIRGRNIKFLATALADVFGKPVLDRSGIKGRYDMVLEWDSQQDRLVSMNAALEPLGLQLVPARERTDMVKVVSVVGDDLEQQFLSIDCFAFGRVGPLGTISEGEQLFRQLLRRSDSPDVFRRTLTNGTPEAACYALCAIRRMAFKQFKREAASLPWLNQDINTMHGCVLSAETGSNVVQWIAEGLYDGLGVPETSN